MECKNKIIFVIVMAKDLIGDFKLFNETIFKKDTNVVSYKISDEIFYYWNYCELFIGIL